MRKVLLFAGTTEGRKAAELLSSNHINTVMCTATEYGKSILAENEHLGILSGRLESIEMERLISSGEFEFVVDATHPFAEKVTVNIKNACLKTNTRYIRLLRDMRSDNDKGCIFVNSAKEAVSVLNNRDGNILLTTGSKDLDDFKNIKNAKERVFARVLPLTEAIEKCVLSGIDQSHIICMKGPFSEEMNTACIRLADAKFIVTKETGNAGGFNEKISAAMKAGIEAIVIKAPGEHNGIGISGLIDILRTDYGIDAVKKIYMVSAGPGNRDNITAGAIAAVSKSTLVIGSKRVLECFDLADKRVFCEIESANIKKIISESNDSCISVVFSGDAGFYSGAQKLADMLGKEKYSIEIINGVSSYVYFFNKIFRPYSNVVFYSMHGRDLNFVDAVRNNEKVFILLGNKNHVSQICSALTEAGLGETEVYIGENLSYPDERISSGRACDFADKENENLSMIYIENKNYENRPYTFGLRDEEFIRGNVPMTKSEVRAISMSKLMLKENSVIYDIGAGTGSVSIECALAAYKGRVFAVEKKAEAVECICKNIEYFHVKNVDVVNGTAPKALKSLPAPTHCFIGGSTGAVKGIIEAVLIKNPCARFVINAISLETMFEAKKAAQEINAEDVEIVNVSISRARAINDLNLMMGLNPVFVISFTGSGVKM